MYNLLTMANIDIDIKNYLTSSTTGNFFLLAGPCVIEGEDMALDLAEQLVKITTPLNIPLVFKGSYRKANRSRIDSFTGIGDFKALEILKKVRDTFGIPVVTDIHETHEAALAAEFVDILQIPAFLCRQTELLLAAARTGKMVNIKKGQFLAPEAMKYAVEKVRSEGNDKVCVTDRGTLFGYHDLIVDMRAFPVMKQACNCPAIADITHSLQQPNTASGVTGGQPEMIATIAKSAIAAGADGIFMETHRDPAKALSDGANMLPLDRVDDLLHRLTAIRYALG